MAETTRVVEESVKNSANGAKIADETVEQLRTIIDGTGKIAVVLEEIEAASKEQAQGIAQITTGLEQIDEITQANTASAEEGAAASEELASQARMLKSYTTRFRLRGHEDSETTVHDGRGDTTDGVDNPSKETTKLYEAGRERMRSTSLVSGG